MSKELNEYAAKIVSSEYPPKGGGLKFISAVAGSGKSTTLVAESYTLHVNKVTPSHKQLLITFSRASARDLKRKIKDMYKGSSYKKLPEVSTIHTLGSLILKKYFKEKFTVLSTWESLVLMRTIMINSGVFKGIPKENDNMRYKSSIAMDVLNLLDNLKANVAFSYSEFISGDFDYSTKIPGTMKINISPTLYAAIVKKYESEKLRTRVYDYTDLVLRCAHLLSEDEKTLRKVRRAYSWIADDEAQDQTRLEWFLILLLAKGKNFMCVGDSCQTIYEWRWADPDKFKFSFLSKYFKEAKEFELPINYRSTANIVEFGNLVRELKGDPLRAIPHKGKVPGSLVYDVVENTSQEALLVCKEIADLVATGDYVYEDFAVIARTNTYLTTVMEPVFLTKGIPYKLSSKTVKKTLDKKDLIVFYRYVLSYLLNPSSHVTLLKVMEYVRGFGDAAINNLLSVMLSGTAIETVASVDKVTDNSLKRLVKIKRDLYRLSKSVQGMSKSDFPNLIDTISGVFHNLLKEGVMTEAKLTELKKVAGSYYIADKEDDSSNTLVELLENFIEDLDGNALENNRNVVRLSTVHAEKGLSARVTFCVGYTLPKTKTVTGEDYNVFYVQVSRAKEKLHLISAAKYVTKEGKVRKATLDPVFRSTLAKATQC